MLSWGLKGDVVGTETRGIRRSSAPSMEQQGAASMGQSTEPGPEQCEAAAEPQLLPYAPAQLLLSANWCCANCLLFEDVEARQVGISWL